VPLRTALVAQVAALVPKILERIQRHYGERGT
jgi:hypothetical protein